MTTRKHTPGPHKLLIGGNFLHVGTADYKSNIDNMHQLTRRAGKLCDVALSNWSSTPFYTEEDLANGYLFAAAADLLEYAEFENDMWAINAIGTMTEEVQVIIDRWMPLLDESMPYRQRHEEPRMDLLLNKSVIGLLLRNRAIKKAIGEE